jgi:hypothetical protein
LAPSAAEKLPAQQTVQAASEVVSANVPAPHGTGAGVPGPGHAPPSVQGAHAAASEDAPVAATKVPPGHSTGAALPCGQ